MEENQNMEKNVSTETAVTKENTSINDENQKKKPFKKKKFNGHLRTSNKKEKFVRPKDEEDESIPSTPKPIHAELFYLLRQKFSYNKVPFFNLLDDVLNVVDIKDIKEGNMTLFSYSAMYEKNEIFVELAKRFPKEIKKDDFENNIVPVCLNKNEEILQNVIQVFNDHLTLDNQFIKEITNKMAKMSYRELNNNLVLNWLNNSFTPELCHNFWNSTFTDRNISLATTALNNTKLKTYLKDNFNQFIELIDKMGKKFEITQKLNLDTKSSIVESNETPVKTINIHEEPKIYLGDKEEQIKNLTKEDVATKVTIKRRKVVA